MSAFVSSPSRVGTAFITMISMGTLLRGTGYSYEEELTVRIVDMTLLLLAAISVLYRLRNRFGGGAAEPNGAVKVSAWAWAF
jgi:hypothetical protein